MLQQLTNVEIEPKLKDVLWVVKAYIARWRVEETIRFIKQSYTMEDIGLRSYTGPRNMMTPVMACESSVSLTLGPRTTLQIMTIRLLDASQRIRNIIRDFNTTRLRTVSGLFWLSRWSHAEGPSLHPRRR